MLQLSFTSGIVLGYVAGSYLHYFTMPLVMLVVPVVFMSVFIWLPSTPQYLLKCDRAAKAERSLRFYRNTKKTGGHGEVATTASPSEKQLCDELDKFVAIAKENAEMPPVRVADFCKYSAVAFLFVKPLKFT